MINPIIILEYGDSRVVEVPKVKDVAEVNNKVVKCKVEHKK